jgi:hypothetical protein
MSAGDSIRKRPIPVTPIHPLLTEWQKSRAVELYLAGQTSRQVAAAVGCDKASVCTSVRRAGHVVRSNAKPRKYRLDESVFDAITDESAYWVGFLMTDGCVSYWKTRQPIVSVGVQERDAAHIDKFRSFLGTDIPVCRFRQSPDSKSGGRGWMCRIAVSSRMLATALARYGVTPRKSLTAKVELLTDNPHFWRGAVDGDGHIYWQKAKNRDGSLRRSPVIGFSSGSVTFATQFAEFCRRTVPGVRANVLTQNRGNNNPIRSVRLSSIGAWKLARLLYTPGAVALDRKAAIADEVSAWLPPSVRKQTAGFTQTTESAGAV